MRFKILIFFICLFLFIIYIWKIMELRHTIELCKCLNIGMTRTDVRKIIGEPIRIKEWEYKGISMEDWYFKAPSIVAEPPRCVFDKKTGKVIEVVCDDNFWLHQK